MKSLGIIFLIICIGIIETRAGTIDGCAYNGRIYTTPSGDNGNPNNRIYYFSASVSYEINYNYNNPSVGHKPCTVEDPVYIGPGCRVRNPSGGFYNTDNIYRSTFIPCNVPIDDHVILAICISIIFSLFFFRKHAIRSVIS